MKGSTSDRDGSELTAVLSTRIPGICWCWLGSREAHRAGDWCQLQWVLAAQGRFFLPAWFLDNLFCLHNPLYFEFVRKVSLYRSSMVCYDGVTMETEIHCGWRHIYKYKRVYLCGSVIARLKTSYQGNQVGYWEAHLKAKTPCDHASELVPMHVDNARQISDVIWDSWNGSEHGGRKVSNPKKLKQSK